MEPLVFANRFLLAGLWVVPVLIWLYWRSQRRAREALGRFAHESLLPRLLVGVDYARRRQKAALLIVSVGLLVLALARPQLGRELRTVKQRGIDIVLALDVSASMQATDVKPSRLEKAKHEIRRLIGKLSGDRIGLLPFAGTAFAYCPLTSDYVGANMFLDAIQPGFIPQPGTALARAIDAGVAMFGSEEKKYKALVLVTDGEGHDAGLKAAARRAKAAGVRVYAIGIGTAEGAPVPVVDDEGRVGGYKRDESGQLVVSRLNEASLREAAELTDGAYFRATTGELELGRIYAQLQALEKREIGTREFAFYEERFQWPLGVAVALMLLELLLPESGRLRDLGRRRGKAALLAAALLLVGWGPFTTAASKSREGNELYRAGKFAESLAAYREAERLGGEVAACRLNAGDAQYKQQQWKAAAEDFERATGAETESLQAKAHYNLGNCQFRQGRFEQAAQSYKRALQLDPSDREAKFNLELALSRLRQQEQQQEQKQQEKQEKNQKQREKEQQSQGKQEKREPQEQQSRPEKREGRQEQAKQEKAQEQRAQAQSAEEKEGGRPGKEQPAVPVRLLTKEEALRILRAAAQDDAKLQQEMLRAPLREEPVPGGKDW